MKLGKNQRKWIDALRSGKYEQGIGDLHNNGKFCCLGVACDLFKDELEVFENSEGIFEYDNKYYTLPKKMVEKLGLYDGRGKKMSNTTSLTNLNDFKNYNFNQIADELENNPEKWFRESA